jgi:hypothetical protein
MHPTRIRFLVGLAVIATAIGWAIATVVFGQTGRAVPVPLVAPLTIWVLTLGVFIWTVLSRPRLQRRPGSRPLHPIVAARTAALAMAGSRTGAIIGGLYAGIGLATIPQFTTVRGAQTIWSSLAIVLGCAALTVIAVWLERLCQVPDEEPPPDAIGFHGV